VNRRIDVNLELEPVPVPAQVFHELCAHAVQSAPEEECCGLIIGNALERYRRVVRCTNEMGALHNKDPQQFPRDARSAFYMSHKDLETATHSADECGETITAVYHSHVGAGAYLSPMDLAFAEHAFFPFPNADQIVVTVFERTAREVGVFRRSDRGFTGYRAEPGES
jgi:proteasome lid subunit RPN8/RPN11